MTTEEYQRICARLTRKAIRYAATMVSDEEVDDDLEVQCERWITLFMNKHLPGIDEDVLLEVTCNAEWDHEVERFWKINNHQTWTSVADLVADFRAKDRPEPRFKDAYKDQEDEITLLATIAGFDLDA